MEVRFNAKKKDILTRLSQPDGEYTDASPKGSVDEPIRELVDEINNTPGFVTTSSCSGRLAVYLEGPSRTSVASTEDGLPNASTSTSGKGGGKWLFTSHAPIEIQRLDQDDAVFSLLGLEPSEQLTYPANDEETQRIHLKFEPMILHILTSSMEHAQVALTAAASAGFRESGISGVMDTKGRPTPPMVAVRSAGLSFDTIIGSLSEGRVLPMVPEAYLLQQLKWANHHFQLNEERKIRFRQHFLGATASGSTPTSDAADTTERRPKPISEKQRRKEARKAASRNSFAEASKQTSDIDVCEPDGFDEGPEADVHVLMGETPF